MWPRCGCSSFSPGRREVLRVSSPAPLSLSWECARNSMLEGERPRTTGSQPSHPREGLPAPARRCPEVLSELPEDPRAWAMHAYCHVSLGSHVVCYTPVPDWYLYIKRSFNTYKYRGFPGGPVTGILGSQCPGARVQPPVRELDPTAHD